jgi:hypothetical protein
MPETGIEKGKRKSKRESGKWRHKSFWYCFIVETVMKKLFVYRLIRSRKSSGQSTHPFIFALPTNSSTATALLRTLEKFLKKLLIAG